MIERWVYLSKSVFLGLQMINESPVHSFVYQVFEDVPWWVKITLAVIAIVALVRIRARVPSPPVGEKKKPKKRKLIKKVNNRAKAGLKQSLCARRQPKPRCHGI